MPSLGKSTKSKLLNEKQIKKDYKRFGFTNQSDYIRFCCKLYSQYIIHSMLS